MRRLLAALVLALTAACGHACGPIYEPGRVPFKLTLANNLGWDMKIGTAAYGDPEWLTTEASPHAFHASYVPRNGAVSLYWSKPPVQIMLLTPFTQRVYAWPIDYGSELVVRIP